MKKALKLIIILILVTMFIIPSCAFAEIDSSEVLVGNPGYTMTQIFGGDRETVINCNNDSIVTLMPDDENSFIEIVDPSTFDVDKEDTLVEGFDSEDLKLGNDTGILMIYANQAMSTGYRVVLNDSITDTTTLKANSFYVIRVKAKALGNAQGSIYLFTDLTPILPELTFSVTKNSKNEVELFNLNPGNDWVEYDYLICTAEKAPKTVGLELWLGDRNNYNPSTGAILFDQVQVYEISSETLFYHYLARIDNENKSNVSIIDGIKHFYDIDDPEKDKNEFSWNSLLTAFGIGFSSLAMVGAIIWVLVRKNVIKIKKHRK